MVVGGALDMPPSASPRVGRKQFMLFCVWCPGRQNAGQELPEAGSVFQKHQIYFQQALPGAFH